MAACTVHCTVVRTNTTASHSIESNHDLLPWADPYIASLMRDLERHERDERAKLEKRRMCVREVFAAAPIDYSAPVALRTA